MTQQEYEEHLRAQGLDPNFPIQQGKRYRVTGWSSHNPLQVMTVWVAEVTDTEVTGHLRMKSDPFVRVSKWSRELANSWVWTEIERGEQ